MQKTHNKQIMSLLRSWDLHSSASRLHYGPILGRYASIMKNLILTFASIFFISCSSEKNSYELVNEDGRLILNGTVVKDLALELDGLNCNKNTNFRLVNHIDSSYDSVIQTMDLISKAGCGSNLNISTSEI